jgi:hypothetical protein
VAASSDRCRSEDLHRRAYNAVFKHYNVLVDGKVRDELLAQPCRSLPHAPTTQVVVWSEEYYDMLSNTVGGGKPKMRWCATAACRSSMGGTVPAPPRVV